MPGYKRDEDVPYYQQLKDKIINDIENGHLAPGDKLPSERELADQYQISRMTARHTLTILEREGLVERRVGAGTFVSSKKIEFDFITFNSFTKSMIGKGLTPSTQILSIYKDQARPMVANKLKIPTTEEVIYIKRLRLVNQVPIAIEESCIPYLYCEGIEDLIEKDKSLYQLLEDVYGITLVKAKQYIRVAFSDDYESKCLKIKVQSPCILQEAVAFDDREKEIEFSTSLTRSDIVNYYSELHLK